MVEYFWGRVFEGISEYWVNTKSPHIPTFLGGGNTGEVNKALVYIYNRGCTLFAPRHRGAPRVYIIYNTTRHLV
jgi:hypothetical protein